MFTSESQNPVPNQPQKDQSPTDASKAPLINPAAKPLNLVKLLIMIGGVLILLVGAFTAFAYVIFSGVDPKVDLTTEKIMGFNAVSFLNMLVTIVHIGFAVLALAALIVVMFFLIKMLRAKKEEPDKKKKALKGLIFAGVGFVVVLAAWITCLIYFEGKREELKLNVTYPPIITEPVDLFQLSAPVTVKFDASHAPVNSEKYQVLSYDWDFGDKRTGSGMIVTHDYTKKGKFDVILTITEMEKTTGVESKAQYTKIVTVTSQSLTAEIIAIPDNGAVPLKVQFDASGSVDPESKIVNYEWDLNGDGQFEPEMNGKTKVEYTYDKVGTYTVTLRVTSLTGKYGTTAQDIVAKATDSPEAKIEVQDQPKTFEKGATYIFKGGSSTSPNGTIVAYEWNFGDGTPVETSKTVTHKFISENAYKVALTVTDEEGKTGTAAIDVVVGITPGMPQAVITTDPALSAGSLVLEGEAPFLVKFNAGASTDSNNDIVDYSWNFTGGEKADAFGKTTSYLFPKEGNYKAALTVTDAKENVSTTNIGIKVNPQGMKAVLSASPLSGEVPLIVNFDASASYYPKGTISSFQWNFGDKTAPVLGAAKISHKYTEIGEYTVTVTVIGTDNVKASAGVNIVVRAVQLSACFKANPTTGKAPLTVIFEPDCSVGSITTYGWTFGDGETSSDVKPTHEFKTPGLYDVKLEVTDNNNTVSTTTAQVQVQP